MLKNKMISTTWVIAALQFAAPSVTFASCVASNKGKQNESPDRDIVEPYFNEFPHIKVDEKCIGGSVADDSDTSLTDEERRLNRSAAERLLIRLKNTQSPVLHVRQALSSNLPLVERLGLEQQPNGVREKELPPNRVELIVVDTKEKWTCKTAEGETITFLTIIAGWSVRGPDLPGFLGPLILRETRPWAVCGW
ncbi:MAG: hypothetical protein SF187_18150 [Deltaproteobacteria bacterium]|nr:hypothetical protein [Deltaproteobacteria bacterium]